MNQEKISAFIKKIRMDNNLTQVAFAKKYNVSYQAVSKWENGKNIPDISILKQICDDYHMDINDLLEGKPSNNISKRVIMTIIVIIGIFSLITLCLFLLPKKNTNDFEFKNLSTSCNNFDLYGSIAYSDTKTAISITNISYCGKEKEDEVYQSLTCTLYENKGDTKKVISTYKSDNELTLEQFLKEAKLDVEHYSNNCQMYKEGALELEIEAITYSNETKLYKIPVTLNDC